MASCGKDEDGVRKIGVAMDYSPSSKRALEWAIRNLLRRGDTLVVLLVQHSSGDEAKRAALWAKSGSRKLPLPTPKQTLTRISSSPPCLLILVCLKTD
jgi:nucleotide-binding universal stress UspA family protein